LYIKLRSSNQGNNPLNPHASNASRCAEQALKGLLKRRSIKGKKRMLPKYLINNTTMEIAFFNGDYLPKDQIKISPDDRGFLFAEGIYEVVRWYGGFFYDMESHLARLKRGLKEIRIVWPEADSFPVIAGELIKRNNLGNTPALVYIQVTRGAAKRTHAFPSPPVSPTVYSFARDFIPENAGQEAGIGVMLKSDLRWARCDIKSVALLPNTLSFQEALDDGCFECTFVRDGFITECTHSNIFFVINGTLYTHPESPFILSGITRKNILRIARKTGITVKEEPVPEKSLSEVSEVFISNTSGEVTPVITIGSLTVGNGKPGPVTHMIRGKFNEEIFTLKG
jgi:D-alanine transaminase